MPKLDKQGRILVPLSIRKLFPYLMSNQKVAICFESEAFFLANAFDENLNNVVSIRSIDDKGRIYIGNLVTDVLDTAKNRVFVVLVRNGKVCIN